ncbi:hypothetical protein M011DRAFT_487160 [Sporormia fimetaria CBS 119925]|uniref:Uncharacterized protein n=1 Tax=Sporormia fimetaria CBS 119925 TaxID=1340428 RepID=A0A6A6V8C2_9PLEO|nr:hypothetical protein M011DRAFT_487160 [Sporormia fimetaria CBS 119925]
MATNPPPGGRLSRLCARTRLKFIGGRYVGFEAPDAAAGSGQPPTPPAQALNLPDCYQEWHDKLTGRIVAMARSEETTWKRNQALVDRLNREVDERDQAIIYLCNELEKEEAQQAPAQEPQDVTAGEPQPQAVTTDPETPCPTQRRLPARANAILSRIQKPSGVQKKAGIQKKAGHRRGATKRVLCEDQLSKALAQMGLETTETPAHSEPAAGTASGASTEPAASRGQKRKRGGPSPDKSLKKPRSH